MEARRFTPRSEAWEVRRHTFSSWSFLVRFSREAWSARCDWSSSCCRGSSGGVEGWRSAASGPGARDSKISERWWTPMRDSSVREKR